MIVALCLSLLGFSEPPAPLTPAKAAAAKEYQAKLATAGSTADAQYRLANWARRQGMKDVADGHLRAAVYLEPNHAAAQKALGRSNKTGVWETKEETQARVENEQNMRAEHATWLTTLEKRGVEGAMQDLSFSEAGAAAIEAYAANDAQRSAAAVKAFRASEHSAATLALVRQAAAARFPEVRKSAVEGLRERNPDHVLPALVGFLKPQIAGSRFVLGVGDIWFWQEGARMFVALPAPPTARLAVRGSAPRAAEVQESFAQRQAASENVRDNTVTALRGVTGLKLDNDYQAWRKAVMQITDSFIDAGPEKVQGVTTTFYRPADNLLIGTSMQQTGPSECFAAGTPVVAKRGLTPIDKICVGELVLSQNPETGETVYKPVLARTLRPRTPMRHIKVGGEVVTATVAHHFWEAERGWTKAKDLALGAALRTETGDVSVSANDAGDPAQAYNLVVADFNTFFVGAAKVLVHDNSPIRDAAPARK